MLDLMDHQVEGVEFLRSNDHAALLDEPGLGKTAQVLLSAKEPVLVVAPALIVTGGVWDEEVEKWAPGIDLTQVSYSSLNPRGPKGVVIDKLRPEFKRRWGTVVADESHYLKNRKAKWTNAFFDLRRDRLALLTGTPIPNWAHEAFTQLKLLYPEEAKPGGRYGSYWRWVNEWFAVGELKDRSGRVLTKWNIEDLLEDRTWDEFREENWADRALRRLRKDVLDLPPLTESYVRVDMKGEQRRVYNGLKKDFVAWLDSGEEIAAWSEADKYMKLAKAATEVDGKGAKVDAYRELIRDRQTPTLAVAHFRRSVEAIARVTEQEGRSVQMVHGGVSDAAKAEAIKQFKSGKVGVLVASVGTVSEGLNLQVADQVIFVERSWTPSRNEQVMRRIHRIGQERPVSAVHLVTRGTTDESVLELLATKTDQQMRALPREEMLNVVGQ